MQLVRYDEMVRAIQACAEVDEVKDIRDKAKALEVYAKQAKNREAERQCAAVRLRAERQWGLLYRDSEKAKPPGDNQYQKVDRSQNGSEPKTLDEMGVSFNQSAEWQGLADISDDQFESALAEMESAEIKPTVAKVKAHVSNNTGNNEWYTPPAIIECARAVMGGIDLDPASSEIANRVVGATVFYSEHHNGLEKDWRGRIWMNPPYSQPLIQQFCKKLKDSPNVEQAIVLVNNGTETKWGQLLLSGCSAVCFPSSRVRFIDPDGNLGSSPLQGQMIFYFGHNSNKFWLEFRELGACIIKK